MMDRDFPGSPGIRACNGSRTLTKEVRAQIIELLGKGKGPASVAVKLGVSHRQVAEIAKSEKRRTA